MRSLKLTSCILTLAHSCPDPPTIGLSDSVDSQIGTHRQSLFRDPIDAAPHRAFKLRIAGRPLTTAGACQVVALMARCRSVAQLAPQIDSAFARLLARPNATLKCRMSRSTGSVSPRPTNLP